MCSESPSPCFRDLRLVERCWDPCDQHSNLVLNNNDCRASPLQVHSKEAQHSLDITMRWEYTAVAPVTAACFQGAWIESSHWNCFVSWLLSARDNWPTLRTFLGRRNRSSSFTKDSSATVFWIHLAPSRITSSTCCTPTTCLCKLSRPMFSPD